MKRLPFALIALAFSIPAVACLNNASDDGAASSSNDLTDLPKEAKDACSFKFTEVENPVGKQGANPAKLELGPVGAGTSGERLLWADYNHDGVQDFMVAAPIVNGEGRFRVYLGKKDADGKFAGFTKTRVKSLPPISNRVYTAVSLLTAGDFDGDKMQDAVVLQTTTAKDGSDARDEIAVLYGNNEGDSAHSALTNAGKLPKLEPLTATSYYQMAGDLDGDGKDDLVYTTLKGETVAFGAARGDVLVADKAIPLEHDFKRSLAFIQPKQGDGPGRNLLIASAPDAKTGAPSTLKSVSFDAQHNATVTSLDAQFPEDGSRWLGTPLTDKSTGDIAILAADGLRIVPVTPTQERSTNTYAGMPGYLIGAADFNGDNNKEILYAASTTALAAACGSGSNASSIVSTPLAIPFSDTLSLAGYVDLDGDGKADIVTLDITPEGAAADPAAADAVSPRGTLRVFLSAGKEDAPSPLTEFTLASSTVTPDAGTDTGTTTNDTDAGADTGTTEVDAGADTGTTEVDSGVDAGDAGKKDPPKKDPPKAQPTGDDDDDDGSSEGPPDGEGSGTKTDKPSKKPTTKPTSTGGATVTTIPKLQTADDGCSTAPGSHGVSSSAFGGLFAAMMLLVRRRRNKRAA